MDEWFARARKCHSFLPSKLATLDCWIFKIRLTDLWVWEFVCVCVCVASTNQDPTGPISSFLLFSPKCLHLLLSLFLSRTVLFAFFSEKTWKVRMIRNILRHITCYNTSVTQVNPVASSTEAPCFLLWFNLVTLPSWHPLWLVVLHLHRHPLYSIGCGLPREDGRWGWRWWRRRRRRRIEKVCSGECFGTREKGWNWRVRLVQTLDPSVKTWRCGCRIVIQVPYILAMPLGPGVVVRIGHWHWWTRQSVRSIIFGTCLVGHRICVVVGPGRLLAKWLSCFCRFQSFSQNFPLLEQLLLVVHFQKGMCYGWRATGPLVVTWKVTGSWFWN